MDPLRSLPRVDTLSSSAALEEFPERVRVEAARQAIEEMRKAIRTGSGLNGHTAEDLAIDRARQLTEATFRPAVNLSGVVLHTGLGRARLAKAATDQVA